jgi:limonene-1,2-epoxide hydrolase
MRRPTDTVRDFMTAFIAAWPSSDAAALSPFFAEGASYHNGPLPPCRGRDAIICSVAQMMSIGGQVDVCVVHLVADGPIVMSERVDHWVSGERTAALHVAGVFEIHDALITSWRDYFHGDEFASQSAEADRGN